MNDQVGSSYVAKQVYKEDKLDGVLERKITFINDAMLGMAERPSMWKRLSHCSKIVETGIGPYKHTEVRFNGRSHKPPCQKEEFKK